MLGPIKHLLKAKHIVLASGSPRRQELVKNIGLEVELCPSEFEENLDYKEFPDFASFVIETANGKAIEVFDRLTRNSTAPDIVIAADTMVTLNEKMFGKPKTPEIAFQMLSELAGKTHVVYTGVVIKHSKGSIKFHESCKVTFGDITKEQIQSYVNTGEPLDKAGGYGVQGIGGCLIKSIEGDYFTVVGLPLYRLCCELCKLFQ
ncbi:dTTP/UTP pyrophosphatase [Condylostylus longicornis]|uniref:dTTP/UTP pyrophosphatase n=1 Tax=Condylostylus longicornis TaxID=2530218 RepID=UPI00244E07DC|nr:dTTP/UTP pyrophosphatase [Condylostylus longicornis]